MSKKQSFKYTKVSVSVFSADISKSGKNFKMPTDQQGFTQLYFLSQDVFWKSTRLQENRCSFNPGTHVEAKSTHFQFCPVTDRHTDRWTDCYDPLPTLGLITPPTS